MIPDVNKYVTANISYVKKGSSKLVAGFSWLQPL